MPGQVHTAEKSNEITAIPELADALMLKGAIVTIDAIGRQQRFARKIVDAGAHQVLSVKEIKPTLLTNMREPLETATQMPGVSRLTTYRLVRAGKLTLVKLGHARIGDCG